MEQLSLDKLRDQDVFVYSDKNNNVYLEFHDHTKSTAKIILSHDFTIYLYNKLSKILGNEKE